MASKNLTGRFLRDEQRELTHSGGAEQQADRRTNCGSLPAGATGYAPMKWWTASQAEEKVQEFMRSGGLFGESLPRDVAERKTLAYLRKNLIGIMS